MKHILTHKNPDLDAIVSAWLAQDFLLEGEESEVIFVNRKIPKRVREIADCVVDVGNAYDPANGLFDHKPPGFEDRNRTCAAKLLWEHLLCLGRDVGHLEPLIQVTFEGDTRRRTKAFQESRQNGAHARLLQMKGKYRDDRVIYARMTKWLRQRYKGPVGKHCEGK